MPRTYKSKNIHTTPAKSGRQNMSEEYIEKHKVTDDNGLMKSLVEMWEIGTTKYKEPRKSAWTADDLIREFGAYFKFCDEKGLKPSKSGLQLFCCISKAQYYSWETEPAKYGEISDLVALANISIENQYINRGEANPTFNTFMLKAKHGYAETQNINVNSSGAITGDEIAKKIAELGISKTE